MDRREIRQRWIQDNFLPMPVQKYKDTIEFCVRVYLRSSSILLEFPLSVIQRTDLTSL